MVTYKVKALKDNKVQLIEVEILYETEHLALHKALPPRIGYSITHKLSGYNVHLKIFNNKELAKKHMKMLEKHVDWSVVPDNGLVSDVFLSHLSQLNALYGKKLC